MKKIVIVFLSIIVVSLSFLFGRSIERSYSYGLGYDEGYSDCSDDISLETYTSYEKGYRIGFKEGYNDHMYSHPFEISDTDMNSLIANITDNAVYYARKHSEFHPEEAMCIIDAWNNGDPYYGSLKVTKSLYQDAIKSLYYFYEYFYADEYR